MLSMENVAGIGDIVFSRSKDDVLSTYALGSCVAVVVYHPVLKIASLVHIALSDSCINPEKAREHPGYFADIAIPNMIEGLKRMKCPINNELNIKLIGGAMLIHTQEIFAIGARNIKAIKKYLKDYGLVKYDEDSGNKISRTVKIETDSGVVTISNAKIGKWTI
jgi:chemotaxis protein CheD